MNHSRFSLADYYHFGRGSRIINGFLIGLLVLLIVAVPLPFASVEAFPTFLMEVVASTCFLLWVLKLLFCTSREKIEGFRRHHAEEKEQYDKSPFFHRWKFLGAALRVLTFGRWPRRYRTSEVLESESSLPNVTFYSIFGFPVRNTGVERVVILFLIFVALQLIPFPKSIVGLISSQTADLYASAYTAAGLELSWHPFTLDPWLTRSRLLEYVSYFMIYLVVVNGSPSKDYQRAILAAFIISAGFQAVYGLIEFLSGHNHIFAFKKKVNLEYATGTFINRNHYAAYLELCIPLLLAVLAGLLEGVTRIKGSIRVVISRALEGEGAKIVLYLFLFAAMVVALVLSLSRGGILFGTVSCLVFCVLYFSSQRGKAGSLIWILPVVAIFSMALWYASGSVITRFSKISKEFIAERSRMQLYEDTLHIFADYPLTGTGMGTFQKVFPMYKSFATGSFYRYAHNDYAQTLAEGGIAGGLVMLALAIAGWTRIREILSKSRKHISAIQIGLFCSLLACALHSMTEFGLQIPAVAVTFTILAAVFWRTSRSDGKIV